MGESLDVGGGGGGAARGALGIIKDWVKARIAEALRTHIGRTWLFVNGVGVAARHKIDVQMTGATGEDHPELDLVRAVLPAGGGDWTLLEHTTISDATASFSWSDIDQTGGVLVLVGRTRMQESSTAAGITVLARFNDVDTDYRLIRRDDGWVGGGVYNANAHTDSTDWWQIGLSPGDDAYQYQIGSFIAWIPAYARTDAYKNLHGWYGFFWGSTIIQSQTFGDWEKYTPQAITKITVSADIGTSHFIAPSEFWLYKVG